MPRIDVRRVLVFATVLLLLRFLVAAVLAFVWPNPGDGSRFLLYYSIECLLDTIVVACVVARLVFVQTIAPSIHAIAAVLVEQLLSALLFSVVLGSLLSVVLGSSPPSPLWLVDYLAFGFGVGLGIFIGLRVRSGATVGLGLKS